MDTSKKEFNQQALTIFFVTEKIEKLRNQIERKTAAKSKAAAAAKNFTRKAKDAAEEAEELELQIADSTREVEELEKDFYEKYQTVRPRGFFKDCQSRGGGG